MAVTNPGKNERLDKGEPKEGPRSENGGMSGQPIGGNDSGTGSGTTLTAGYSLPHESEGQTAEGAADERLD